MLRRQGSRHLHEHAADLSIGYRIARAPRAANEVAAQGILRGILSRVRERDEPAADGTTLRPQRREARAEQNRGASQEAARPDAGRCGADQRGEGRDARPDGAPRRAAAADQDGPRAAAAAAAEHGQPLQDEGRTARGALQREDSRLEASETLRGLIDSIVLTPEEGQPPSRGGEDSRFGGPRLRIELRGNLAV